MLIQTLCSEQIPKCNSEQLASVGTPAEPNCGIFYGCYCRSRENYQELRRAGRADAREGVVESAVDRREPGGPPGARRTVETEVDY